MTALPLEPIDTTAQWTRALARWLPAAALAYPLFVFPLLFGVSPDTGNQLNVSVAVGSNTLSQLWFLSIFGLALLAFAAAGWHRLPLLLDRAILVLVPILVLFAVSMAWSPFPGTALRRAILQIIIVTSVILSVIAADDERGVIERVFLLVAAVIGANAVSAVFLPPGPIGFEGLMSQKNQLGAACTFAVVVALHQAVAGRAAFRLLALPVIVLAMALLVYSQSKTSLGLVFIAPAVALALAFAARAGALPMPLLAIMAFGGLWLVYTLGVGLHLWTFNSLATALFGDPTLTTRTDIWRFAMAMIERQPLLGWGFESFWQNGAASPGVREGPGFVSRMPHAHNGYIDITLQTGFLGLALLLPVWLLAFGAAGRALRRDFWTGLFLVTVLVLVSFQNLLESTWFRGFNFLQIAFLATVALSVTLARREGAAGR